MKIKKLIMIALICFFVMSPSLAIAKNVTVKEDVIMEQDLDVGGNATVENTFIVNSGNVGIGTDNPASILDIVNGSTVGIYTSTNGDADASYWLGTDRDNNGGGLKWANLSYIDSDDTLRLNNSSTRTDKHFVIDSSGNIGINETSPGAKLHIAGTGYNGMFFDNTGTTGDKWILYAGDNATIVADGAFALYNSDTGVSPFVILPNGNIGFYFTAEADIINRFNINGSGYIAGNLGIKNSSPDDELDVIGDAEISGKLSTGDGIVLSNTSNTDKGIIRFNDPDFEGYNGTGWEKLGVDLSLSGTVPASYISGFNIEQVDSDTIEIQLGEGVCNGNYFLTASAITHDMTSLVAGYDLHYVYIDDSTSTYPSSIVIIDATTEPAYNASKSGWYNGDDRCIGVVASGGTADLIDFISEDGTHYGWDLALTMASAMNPDNTWQTPDDYEGDTLTPVNTIGMLLIVRAEDTGSNLVAKGTAIAKELADAGAPPITGIHGGGIIAWSWKYARVIDWIKVGPSRKIRISGEEADDNALTLYLAGYEIER